MANPDPLEIVKRQLWRNGLSARDVSKARLGYDLIVNFKHKVKVRVSTERGKTAPPGVTLAIVGPTGITYSKCDKTTCTPTNGSLAKLFSI